MIKLKQPTQEELIQQLENDVARLEEENKELMKAVEFYGDDSNWEDCWIDGCMGSEDYFTSIKDDMGARVGGYRAREAKRKIQELREE